MILRLTTIGRTTLADGANAATRAVTLTRLATGDQYGSGGAADDARTALRSERDSAAAAGSTTEPGRLVARADLTPTAAYAVTEVGLFAQVGTDPEILLAYWTANGDVLAATSAGITLILAAVVELTAAAADVTVALDPTISITGDRPWLTWPLGGEQDFRQTSAAYEEIKASAHAGRDIRLQAMATVDGGTGALRLYNVTAAAAVGTPVSVTATTTTLVTSGPLTLPASLATYRAEAQKGTTWIPSGVPHSSSANHDRARRPRRLWGIAPRAAQRRDDPSRHHGHREYGGQCA